MANLKQNYTNYYSNSETISPKVFQSTVEEILTLAEKKLDKSRKLIEVLDVGSGFGDYSIPLAKQVKKVIGIEPNRQAYDLAVTKNKSENLKFINDLVEKYKGKDKFDVILSLTTIEHMP